MNGLFIVIAVAILLSLGFATFNYFTVKKMSPGTERMAEIANIIHEGAQTFIRQEYKIIAISVVVVAIVFCITLSWYSALAFCIGVSMSGLAGYIGMKIATISNVRVSNAARETREIGATLKVAFQGGSVMGLCVAGFALLGLVLVFLIFGYGFGQLDPEMLKTNYENHIGITFIPFTMTITCYSLGCSLVALFNRVGGGIYTKAADMGADLVGKTEAGIPEDDPRNPATIADNVGDNVGDVAGLGSDLLESFVAAIVSCIVFCIYTYFYSYEPGCMPEGINPISADFVKSLIMYPVAFAAVGLIACIFGIALVIFKKKSTDPHRELNISLFVSAGLSVLGGLAVTHYVLGGFSTEDFLSIGFRLGAYSPAITAGIGIIAGVIIGLFAEYYTSYDYAPTQEVSESAIEGPAIVITTGMAVGMKSCFLPVGVLAIAIIISNYISGLYGVAMAAVGMLSFVASTVAVDTYGPISDNAGGISEMCSLPSEVREITDKLDSVGNTTAAVGKGFAIGSAALAALSLLASYMHSQGAEGNALSPSLNIIDTVTLAGCFVGAVLPYLFSGLLIKAVGKSAQKMVLEVRRQFRDIPGIMQGKAKPEYNRCIQISSSGAIAEMRLPVIISICTPLVSGFIFGPNFVGGLLIGATASAIMLALYTANAGGSWDNAKKYIESGGVSGHAKGSPAHAAAVIGDTVGDPLKDTVGPSLDILIKIMATVSLIAVCIFKDYNFFSLFQ